MRDTVGMHGLGACALLVLFATTHAACTSGTAPRNPGGGGSDEFELTFTGQPVSEGVILPDVTASGGEGQIVVEGGLDDDEFCYSIGANLTGIDFDLRLVVDARPTEVCEEPVAKWVYHGIVSELPDGTYQFRVDHISSEQVTETVLQTVVTVD